MAQHRYRVLQEAIDRQAPFADGLEPGAEIDHDFAREYANAPDVERAVVAAGWVERVDEPDTDTTKKNAKGGSK